MTFRNFAAAFAVSAALAFAAPAAADAVKFGARTLEIPPPAGMVPVGGEFPALLANTQAYLPPTNRLVEMYVPAETLEGMRARTVDVMPRTAQLQVMHEFDGVSLPEGEFTAGLGAMEAGIVAQAKEMESAARDLAAQGNAQTQSQLSMGGVQMHGVTRKEPWGLFFTSSLEAAPDPQSKPIRIFVGNAIVLVDGQMMLLSSYAHESVPEARAEVERSVFAWAEAIRAAHGAAAVAADVPAAAPAATPAPEAAEEKGGMMKILMLLGAVGLVVGGIVMVLLARRRG
jgi:hypothetical protein